MRRRDFLAVAGTAATAALAGCTAGADDGRTDGTDDGDGGTDDGAGPETLVQVGAGGEVEAEPDLAVVNVGIVASGQDAGAIRDELATRAENVKQALLGAGVPEENIRTVRFEIEESRRERESRGLQGEHVYQVDVENTDRVGELIDVAVNAGADDVGHVRFTLAEETADQLREEALRKALENARGEAETIADAEALTITGIEEVSTTRTDVHATRAEVAEDAGDGGTDIDAGPVTVSAQVSVTYRARPQG